jgi:exoribonuclease R
VSGRLDAQAVPIADGAEKLDKLVRLVPLAEELRTACEAVVHMVDPTLDDDPSPPRHRSPPLDPEASYHRIGKIVGPGTCYGAGEYIVELPGQDASGHFGLAVRDYTHSTAPNRRFPDLITQRLVKAALAGAPTPYVAEDLAQLAAHCTTQEDAANKVERQVGKSAAALLLSSHVGERFDAIVTGAAAKGT